jgi:cell division protein FtsW
MQRARAFSFDRLPNIDGFFLQLTIALVVIGFIFISSTSWFESIRYYDNPWAFLFKHSITAVFGVSIMLVSSFVHFRWLKKFAWAAVIATIILLLITMLFGSVAGGSRRWIDIGFFHLQVSEFAKVFSALLISKALFEKKNRLLAFGAVLLMALMVLKQPDLGTSILIIGAAVAAIFASGFNLFVFFGGFFALVVAGYFQVVSTPYQMNRIRYWLDPYSDPMGHGYNLIQSIKAIANGGLWGVGFGASTQKLGPLPVAYADFIFAIICEEIGFLGATALLFLFAAWILRAMYICYETYDEFGRVFGIALITVFAAQVLINIGVAIGLFPITGMPLPFVSFGGSSFLSSSFIAGIIMNISRQPSRA